VVRLSTLPGGPGFLANPIDVAGSGSLNTVTEDEHLRQLIMQVLFTEPGERLNLPEFGCGVKRLLFAPNNDVLAATVQFLITQNLRRWLGNQLDVERVQVSSPPDEEFTLLVDVVYTVKASDQRQQLSIQI
jgi:phage baseplate assembly protein W